MKKKRIWIRKIIFSIWLFSLVSFLTPYTYSNSYIKSYIFKSKFNLWTLLPHTQNIVVLGIDLKKILTSPIIEKIISSIDNSWLLTTYKFLKNIDFDFSVEEANLILAFKDKEHFSLFVHGFFSLKKFLKELEQILKNNKVKVKKSSYMEKDFYYALYDKYKFAFGFLDRDIFLLASTNWLKKSIEFFVRWTSSYLRKEKELFKMVTVNKKDPLFWGFSFWNWQDLQLSYFPEITRYKEYFSLVKYLYWQISIKKEQLEVKVCFYVLPEDYFQFSMYLATATQLFLSYYSSIFTQLSPEELQHRLHVHSLENTITLKFYVNFNELEVLLDKYIGVKFKNEE